MNEEYYNEHYKEFVKITEQSNLNKQSFLQSLLLLASSILGILMSLHSTHSECLYIRLVFVLSTILLLVGNICLSVVLYDFSNLPKRMAVLLEKEVRNAKSKAVEVPPLLVNHKKRTSILEKIAYVLLITGLVLQVVYSALLTIIC